MPGAIQPVDNLKLALEPYVESQRRFKQSLGTTAVLLAALVVTGCALLTGYLATRPLLPALVVFSLGAAFGIRQLFSRHSPQDYFAVARDLERQNPDFNGLLLTALEQSPERTRGTWHFLQRRVVTQAAALFQSRQWRSKISNTRQMVISICNGLLMVSLVALLYWHTRGAHGQIGGSGATAGPILTELLPGSVTVESGSSLIFTAKFDKPPAEVSLIRRAGGKEERLPMQKSLSDPFFGAAVSEVKDGFDYTVAFDGQVSREYSVGIFQLPQVEQTDVTLHFPEYTNLPEKVIRQTQRVSMVEGSTIDLRLKLNKGVRSATLVPKDGSPAIPLTVIPNQPFATLVGLRPTGSQSYEIQLKDDDGRSAKLISTFAVDVQPNKRPEIKILSPKGDLRVSPLQEITFEPQVWDDYGITRYGVSFTVAGGATEERVLGSTTAANQRTANATTLHLEDLGVQPDQLITWFAWAEDSGADGAVRRIATDIYFAEVRPFDEVFRQGDSNEAGGEGGGAGEEAQKLGELQKQIIAATWKLQRQEGETVGSREGLQPGFSKDAAVIHESQAAALEQAKGMESKLQDDRAKALAGAAVGEMQKAAGILQEVPAAPRKLGDALEAEQTAYNALLKLAAHEFRVSRSKSSSSGKESGAKQQQLDQLEMKEEKQRYETQKEATPQQKEQTKAQLAILSRLKELAQRQHDINERAKELQVALQEAQTGKAKEDLKKELKRLQEKQQQMLADVDELQKKMQEQPNNSEYAQERQELDKAREEAQRTSESLRQEKTGEALAAGSRTERGLEKLQDDFRKKSSAQFNEQMRNMRSEARTLATEQQELAERLGFAGEKPPAPSLKAKSPREDFAQRASDQQERLKSLQGEMKSVSEQAESAEPLLAKQLYDALRKTAQANTEETLRKTGLLAARGYKAQAKEFGDKAQGEINQLKEGIEKAAESVMGNEEEALKTAKAELESLADQLEKEISANTPETSRLAGNPVETDKTLGKADSKQAPAPGAEEDKAGENSEPGKTPGEKRSQETAKAANQPGGKNPGEEQSANPTATGGATTGQKPGKSGGGEMEGSDQPSQRTASSRKEGQTSDSQAEGAGKSENGSSGEPSGDPGNVQGSEKDQAGGNLQQLASKPPLRRGGIRAGGGGASGVQGGGIDEVEGPIKGNKYAEWSDRLRNVEEMVDDPATRMEVARIREAARVARAEYKRHSEEPKWDLLRSQVSRPLVQLRDRLGEEIARKGSRDSLAPVDRDPVPARYAEQVEKYYETLGGTDTSKLTK